MRSRERPERDRSGHDRTRLADRLLGVARRRYRSLRAGDQQTPGVGEDEPAVRAHEQRDAKPVLEPAQLLGQARLRNEARLRRARHRAALDGRQEVAQLLQASRP